MKYQDPSDTGTALMVENFIIRLYRFEKDNPRNLVGIVEIVGKKGRIAFTNMDELWEILNSSFGEEKEGESVESVELKKKRRIVRIPVSFAFTDPSPTRLSEFLKRLGLKERRIPIIVYSRWEPLGAIKRCQYDGSRGILASLWSLLKVEMRTF